VTDTTPDCDQRTSVRAPVGTELSGCDCTLLQGERAGSYDVAGRIGILQESCMPWTQPERQPRAPDCARDRHRRSVADGSRFPRMRCNVAQPHAHSGFARIAASHGNLSSGTTFLPAR